jgi:hypothetical protein
MPKTYEPIATTTVTTTGNTVTFSSIPSTYTDLILVSSARRGINGSGGDGLKCQFNGDSASNYSFSSGIGNGSAASASTSTGQTVFIAGSCGDNKYNASICHILNYANTSTYKTVLTRANDTTDQNVSIGVSLWRSTSAINSIYINAASAFWSGTTFTLYGIKAA